MWDNRIGWTQCTYLFLITRWFFEDIRSRHIYTVQDMRRRFANIDPENRFRTSFWGIRVVYRDNFEALLLQMEILSWNYLGYETLRKFICKKRSPKGSQLLCVGQEDFFTSLHKHLDNLSHLRLAFDRSKYVLALCDWSRRWFWNQGWRSKELSRLKRLRWWRGKLLFWSPFYKVYKSNFNLIIWNFKKMRYYELGFRLL